MKTDREIVCIVCPNGCRMKVFVDEQNRVAHVDNALCRNGRTYAENEVQCPKRSLTSTIKVKGGTHPLVSVRSNKPIPKEKIQEAVKALREIELAAPVEFHQVEVSDILGTGADIITTKQILSLSREVAEQLR
jgi:CxxC motif-containing protein